MEKPVNATNTPKPGQPPTPATKEPRKSLRIQALEERVAPAVWEVL